MGRPHPPRARASTGFKSFASGGFAGLSAERWFFALRMWLAIQIALGVAFWLQLDGAHEAGVIAALLAMQTRGQAFEKGGYLFLGTAVGGAMAIVIVGLFAQTRDLYVIAYSAWLAVCIFGAGFLDGNRAYGAVVCGYTVSIVAVFQIDDPNSVFSEVVNRCAAIAVGIASVLLVVDAFRGADIGPKLVARLGAGCARARALTDEMLCGRPAPVTDAQVAKALAVVSVQHPLLNALPIEAVSGTARAGAVRATLAALVGEIETARALDTARRREASLGDPRLRGLVVRRLHGELHARRTGSAAAFAAARDGRSVAHPPRMPVYRPARNALRNALRAFVASVLVGFLFVGLGWPQTASSWGMVGIIMCFAANAPDPGAMTKGALIAVPGAAVLGGVTQFLVLNGVDQFPLLMIGTAPALIGALLLTSSPKPALASVGLLLGVFTVVFVSPSNPQKYDPQSYVVSALLLPMAAVLSFMLVRLLFPTSDADRLRWALAAARRDMFAALRGEKLGRLEDEARLLAASRIGSAAGLSGIKPAELAALLRMADLARAGRRIWRGLHGPTARYVGSGRLPADVDGAARASLAAADAGGLRRAAGALLDAGEGGLLPLAADLAWAADLIDAPAEVGSVAPAVCTP